MTPFARSAEKAPAHLPTGNPAPAAALSEQLPALPRRAGAFPPEASPPSGASVLLSGAPWVHLSPLSHGNPELTSKRCACSSVCPGTRRRCPPGPQRAGRGSPGARVPRRRPPAASARAGVPHAGSGITSACHKRRRSPDRGADPRRRHRALRPLRVITCLGPLGTRPQLGPLGCAPAGRRPQAPCLPLVWRPGGARAPREAPRARPGHSPPARYLHWRSDCPAEGGPQRIN